jgi:hypothetical protein
MAMFETNGMLILDVWWFGTGGVVICWDPVVNEFKGYIKDIKTTRGPLGFISDSISEQEKTIIDIASWGDKVPKATLQGFFPGIDLDETKNIRESNPGYFL